MARELKYRIDGGSEQGPVSEDDPLTISGLTNDTEVTVEIKVVDGIIESSWSNLVSVTPEEDQEPPVLTDKFYGFWDWDDVSSSGRDEWEDYGNLHKLKSVGESSVINDLQNRGLRAMSYIGNIHGGMSDSQLRGYIDNAGSVLNNVSPEFMPYVMIRDEPTSKGMDRDQMEMVVDYAKQLYPQFRFGYTENEIGVRNRSSMFPRNVDFLGYQTYPYRNPDAGWFYSGSWNFQSTIGRHEGALRNYLTHWLNRIRNAVPEIPEYFIIAQGFAGSDKGGHSPNNHPKWIDLPDNAATWYVNYMNDHDDVNGLLWWKWRASTKEISGTGYPTGTIGRPDSGHSDPRYSLTLESVQNMKDAYALLNQ